MGVETETASGQIKGANKTVIDISAGLVNNEVRTSTTNVNMEMGMQLTGVWKEDDKNPAKETGNARTKAWRVLHRCTYVSRVPEKVEQRPAAQANVEPEKKSTLLADVACNWLLLQKLEPFARGIESRAMLATALKPHVSRLFPTLISQTRLYVQVLNLVADYVGLA